MRALERAAELLGLPGPALMENAGRVVAAAIADRIPRSIAPNVLVLVGPGNNGGDGLVAARHLHDSGYRVTVYLASRLRVDDAKEKLLGQRNILILDGEADPSRRELDLALSGNDLVVDAILGTGHSRAIGEPLASVFKRVNERGAARIVAVDLPSGVNADTGEIDPLAFRATITVSLGHPKRGLLVGPAAGHVGELVNVDIGIPAEASDILPVHYADAGSVAKLLPSRSPGSHKGSFGRVLIVAGSRLYTGAPVLAALGAERVGAGLVTLACPETIRASLAAHTLETTFMPLPDHGTGEIGPEALDLIKDRLTDFNAVLVGPGIGRARSTDEFLAKLLVQLGEQNLPTIIDADALTLVSAWPGWWEKLPASTILTPHGGEMARLLGRAVGPDRVDAALNSAATWGAVVVLKGAYTIVAQPQGPATVLPFANPALATAGTGDVLGGAILGLLSQGAPSATAALVGAYLHGLAGQILSMNRGPAGGLASEVADNLPTARRLIVAPDPLPRDASE